jgi:hypothetical protein
LLAQNSIDSHIFQVSVLEDATLLGFRVPHHFCDGESVYAIVKAYCATIAGEKVASLVMPPDVDRPLSSVLKEDTGITLPTGMGTEGVPYLYPNENLCLGFGPWIRYVGYAVSRMVGSKLGIFPKSREQFIHLPGKLVAHWRDECQKELEQLMASDDGQEVPNPSKLDAITAWFLQVSYQPLELAHRSIITVLKLVIIQFDFFIDIPPRNPSR